MDVGTMTTELSLTLRAVISAIAIDERYGRQIALGRLRAMLPPGKTLVEAASDYTRGPFTLSKQNGQVSFTARASGRALADVDALALRDQLAGLSLSDARALLRAQPAISVAEPPQLVLYPPGIEAMPILPIRIELRLKDPA